MQDGCYGSCEFDRSGWLPARSLRCTAIIRTRGLTHARQTSSRTETLYKTPTHQDSGFDEEQSLLSPANKTALEPSAAGNASGTGPDAERAAETTYLLPLSSSRRRMRQTVPAWAGVLVLLGVLGWAGWCAVFVARSVRV